MHRAPSSTCAAATPDARRDPGLVDPPVRRARRMGVPVVVLPEPPARPVVALGAPAPTRRRTAAAAAAELRGVGSGVEVADDDAGLHRRGVQVGHGGELGGPVAAGPAVRCVTVTHSAPPSSSIIVRRALRGSPAARQPVHVADQDRQPRQQRVAVLAARPPGAPRLVERRPPGQLHVQRAGQQQRLVDVLAARRRSAGRPPAGRSRRRRRRPAPGPAGGGRAGRRPRPRGGC